MGFSIDGYEEEILELLRRLEIRKKKIIVGKGQKKRAHVDLMYERKLRKLECFVTYKFDSAIGRRGDKNMWELSRVHQLSYASFLGILKGSMKGRNIESSSLSYIHTQSILYAFKKQRSNIC